MPGMEDYMAAQQQQQMGGGGGPSAPQPQPQQAPPAPPGMMSLGGQGGQMLQPNFGSAEAERTPLNDRIYSGGEMTRLWKRLLLERQQARAAASAQYQRGQLAQNQHVE